MNKLFSLMIICFLAIALAFARITESVAAAIFVPGQEDTQGPDAKSKAVRQNPFLTEEENKFFKEQGDIVPLKHLALSAIFYSPQKSSAIVDGKVVREGDIIDNKRIIQIKPEEILLQDTRSTYSVRMAEITYKPNPLEKR